MPSIADVYVTILPETSRVADGIRRALRSVDADMYRSGKRWGDEIKRGMGDVGLDVDANTEKARRKVKELDRELDKDHKIKVDIQHDKSSFAALATGARTIEQNFQSLAIATAAIPNTIASVGSAVASLSGVMGLLPATVGTAALAMGSLKVATLGFGDAMKNIGDPEKFAASLAQLSPNAQQAASAIQTLMPQITQLKMTVQDAFFAGFGDQIKQLGSTYLPMFQGVMSQMAASANTSLTSVSKMLQTPAMAGDMSAMTGNMASAFNVLSQALAPIVKSIMDIGVVGSGFLPALAQAATQAATAFAVFIDKARSTGELQGWIQTGIDAFKQLMDIAGNVGGIIGGIMKAAPPGGGLFGTLAQLTQMLSDFVNSPAGQGAFNTFMTSMQASMQALMPAVGALLQALAPILGYVGQFAAVLITSLAPALQTWFEAMTPVIQQIVGALQPVLAALAPVLSQVAGTIAQQMVSGIQQILPVLMPMVQQFGQLVIALLPLVPSLMQLAMSAIPAFQQAVAMVLPLVTQMMQFLTQLANTVVPALIDVVNVLASSFSIQWQGISLAVKTAVAVIGPLLDLLTQKIQQFLDGPVGKLLGALAGPIPRAIGAVLDRPTTANTGPGAAGGNPALGGGQLPGLPLPGQQTLGGIPAAPGAGGRHPGRKAGVAPQTSTFNASGGIPAAPMPAVSNYVPPAVTSGGGGGGGGGGGTTPAALSPTGVDWDAIAQKESSGHWDLNTKNGYYGGLQFDLATWQQFGGTEFAERPDLASKEQQIAVAERVPVGERAQRWPNTYSAGATGRPAAGTTPTSATSGYSSAAAASTSGSTDPRTFAHDTMMPFWQSMGLQVGDHAADQYGEHQHGALDIMVPDIATGQQVLQQVLSDPNVYGAIFNKQSYGYGHGATPKDYTGPNPHTDHVHAWYKPGNAGNINPSGTGGVGAGYGTTPYDMSYSGSYDDKAIREAQEKVADTEQRIKDEEAQLQKLRMKPGATPEDIAKQEYAVAKAKREHADATKDLAAAQDKYNKSSGKDGGSSSFGQDFMSGIAEFFGFDGSLFKSPADFGLTKLLGAATKLKVKGSDGSSTPLLQGLFAPGGEDGGGGGGLGGLLSTIPQAFGALGQNPSQDMGGFQPMMPNADSGGVLGRAFAPPGVAGPGNDNSVNVTVNNPIGQDHLQQTFETADRAKYPAVRQQTRNLPK